MDYLALIDKYYAGFPELRHILLTHSRQVADRSLSIIDRHPEWEADGLVDRQFVEEAAMLHDIGIIFCDAPKIHCTGSHKYIEHGYLGAELLRQEGLPKHALVAERHTGKKLQLQEIKNIKFLYMLVPQENHPVVFHLAIDTDSWKVQATVKDNETLYAKMSLRYSLK